MAFANPSLFEQLTHNTLNFRGRMTQYDKRMV